MFRSKLPWTLSGQDPGQDSFGHHFTTLSHTVKEVFISCLLFKTLEPWSQSQFFGAGCCTKPSPQPWLLSVCPATYDILDSLNFTHLGFYIYHCGQIKPQQCTWICCVQDLLCPLKGLCEFYEHMPACNAKPRLPGLERCQWEQQQHQASPMPPWGYLSISTASVR